MSSWTDRVAYRLPGILWSGFVIRASVEDIYRYGLAAARWFSFYPSYAGLDGVEGDWPEVGSAIRVRYRVVLGLIMTLRQEVVAHERGSFIEFEERFLRDLWIDSPQLGFAPRPDE